MASGRTVVVTGGARGIGRAVVERFAAAGDDVLALGRDPGSLARPSAGGPGGAHTARGAAAAPAAGAGDAARALGRDPGSLARLSAEVPGGVHTARVDVTDEDEVAAC